MPHVRNFYRYCQVFNETKGFGFTQQAEGKDVFVHYSVINSKGFRSLKEGQRVSFEIKDGPKRPQAENVQPLNP